MAAEAFIVDAIRTPTGRRRGGLAHVHPADLGGHVLRSIAVRSHFESLHGSNQQEGPSSRGTQQPPDEGVSKNHRHQQGPGLITETLSLYQGRGGPQTANSGANKLCSFRVFRD